MMVRLETTLLINYTETNAALHQSMNSCSIESSADASIAFTTPNNLDIAVTPFTLLLMYKTGWWGHYESPARVAQRWIRVSTPKIISCSLNQKPLPLAGIPCIWNHSGMWNLSYKTGRTSLCRERCLSRGRRTSKSWSSYGCPAENGTHGIPFNGCSRKLKGLLSTITIRHKSFDKEDRSFTCSLYSVLTVEGR